MMKIEQFDHLVLTVRDIGATCRFYTQVLGMQESSFAGQRKALHFGKQKINLHLYGHEFEPKAAYPTPGAADWCFITQSSIVEVVAHLQAHQIPIEEGPVRRTGARGMIESVYVRDPDQNLIEIAVYADGSI